jgi:hypothetical protein
LEFFHVTISRSSIDLDELATPRLTDLNVVVLSSFLSARVAKNQQEVPGYPAARAVWLWESRTNAFLQSAFSDRGQFAQTAGLRLRCGKAGLCRRARPQSATVAGQIGAYGFCSGIETIPGGTHSFAALTRLTPGWGPLKLWLGADSSCPNRIECAVG